MTVTMKYGEPSFKSVTPSSNNMKRITERIVHGADTPMRPLNEWSDDELAEERERLTEELEIALSDTNRDNLSGLMEIERELTLREER